MLNRPDGVTTRQRFIAGAVCPHCKEEDTLAIWQEDQHDVAGCVACGQRLSPASEKSNPDLKTDTQLIAILKPT